MIKFIDYSFNYLTERHDCTVAISMSCAPTLKCLSHAHIPVERLFFEHNSDTTPDYVSELNALLKKFHGMCPEISRPPLSAFWPKILRTPSAD